MSDQKLTNLLNKKNCFVFDLDNTLINLNADWKRIKQNLAIFQKRYFNQIIEKDLFMTNQDLLEKTYGVESVKKILNYLEKEENFAASNLSEINQNGIKILNLIKNDIIKPNQNKKWIYILSNNFKSTIEIALKKFNLIKSFDGYIGRDSGFKMKPSPQGLNYIFNNIGLDNKKNLIFFGDSLIDQKTAKLFGCDYLYIQKL